MKLSRVHQDTKGVTLIEFVMMLAVLGIVIGGIYQFVVNGAISASKTNDFMQSQSQIRSALDNFVDESRWGQLVTAANQTSVTVQIPQGTPYYPSASYSVVFAYDSTNKAITRQQCTPGCGSAVPLAYLVVGPGGAAGLNFSYYDGGNTSFGSTPTSGQLPNIARIRAVVTTTSGTVTRYLAGDAALRAH
jgi:type II secretory pathway pseudopilin PulG